MLQAAHETLGLPFPMHCETWGCYVFVVVVKGDSSGLRDPGFSLAPLGKTRLELCARLFSEFPWWRLELYKMPL